MRVLARGQSSRPFALSLHRRLALSPSHPFATLPPHPLFWQNLAVATKGEPYHPLTCSCERGRTHHAHLFIRARRYSLPHAHPRLPALHPPPQAPYPSFAYAVRARACTQTHQRLCACMCSLARPPLILTCAHRPHAALTPPRRTPERPRSHALTPPRNVVPAPQTHPFVLAPNLALSRPPRKLASTPSHHHHSRPTSDMVNVNVNAMQAPQLCRWCAFVDVNAVSHVICP